MPWGVPPVVGADMLGDAAELARHDVRLADRVQELGLSVVDMAHDRDDGRPRQAVRVPALLLDDRLVVEGDDVDLAVVFGGEDGRGVGVDLLVDGAMMPMS